MAGNATEDATAAVETEKKAAKNNTKKKVDRTLYLIRRLYQVIFVNLHTKRVGRKPNGNERAVIRNNAIRIFPDE